jgi:hypothetical protein
MELEQQAQLEMMAGSVVRQMLKSRETTESYLTDADPKARYAALLLLTHQWAPPTEQFAMTCEQMALRDTDATVRAIALTCLGNCYASTDDRRIGAVIATLVRTESEDYKVRRSAYGALFSVGGVPIESWPDLDGLRFPDDVDWQFVNTFLKESS